MASLAERLTNDLDKAKHSKRLILSIDIGTTNIKTALVNYSSQYIIGRGNVKHDADIALDFEEFHEQDVNKLLIALDKCIELLPEEERHHVQDVVVCGQMHGCVLWNKNVLRPFKNKSMQEAIQNLTSNLITWQDKRCSSEFLLSLPSFPPASGFGCATLLWFVNNEPDILACYDCAGTIMDFVVNYLCCNSEVFMSTQNACGWGYYDITKKEWEFDKLKSANFPTHLLPKVCDPGFIVGELSQVWHGVQTGTKVHVALGDMQCSILATHAQPFDAVLNIGTSAQLSVVIDEQKYNMELGRELSSNPALHISPYFDQHFIIVAASLNGGNVLTCFVKMLQSWLQDLGLDSLSHEEIHERLSALAHQGSDTSQLKVTPVLWGERHDPNQRASVHGISPDSLSLEAMFSSICHGLLVNIQMMMSNDFLEFCNIKKIIGTGKALLQNKIMQKSASKVFTQKFVLCADSDAALGATMSVTSKCLHFDPK